MRNNLKKEGFTLIELIVTLAILGLILAIAVPNYLNMVKHANMRKVADDCRIVEKAVEVYHATVESYPTLQSVHKTNQEFLTGKKPDGSLAAEVFRPEGWAGPYLDFWPVNPFNPKSEENVENNDTYQLDYRTFGSVKYLVLEIPFVPLDAEARAYLDEILDGGDGLKAGKFRADSKKWSYYVVGEY
jgi:general secretion pathway protein G